MLPLTLCEVAMNRTIFDFTMKDIAENDVPLSQYQGKVTLIVNTASKCGLTPQFEGLEQLYKSYKSDGLEILGFPCNQFAEQEKGDNSQIAEFCLKNYGVSFLMFSKIDVNGNTAAPLYQHLKAEAPGFLGSGRIKWNFTKFLIGKDGTVIKRFSPTTKPAQIEKAIKKALAA
jgi:glutathione peroxidase